jgi:hypothetical protein
VDIGRVTPSNRRDGKWNRAEFHARRYLEKAYGYCKREEARQKFIEMARVILLNNPTLFNRLDNEIRKKYRDRNGF